MDTSPGGKAKQGNHSRTLSSPHCVRTTSKNDALEAASTPATTTQTLTHGSKLKPQADTDTAYRTSNARHHKRTRDNSVESSRSPSRGPHLNTSQPTLAPDSEIPRSDMEVLYDLYQLLDELSGLQDIDLVDSFQRASLQAPITHESLSELDIPRIINNPKLRHDVNFDKELHFRPNLDGSRGRHKVKAAEDYWKALIAELELYRAIGTRLITCETQQDLEYWTRMMSTSQKRMPGMFETIRDVLRTLVPERDQPSVAERLDVSMIMQQISKGLFNLMDLAQWLAKLLKAHCAPMRDDWIDQMVTLTQCGVADGCQRRIVHGLKHLLGILEAMKLDVANHQIRHLRALLIEDAVNFQQQYHLHRLSYGRIDISGASRWLEKERRVQNGQGDTLQVFTSALLKTLLSASPVTAFPETFNLDHERLRSMRSDLHNIVHLRICSDIFIEILDRTMNDGARQLALAALRTSLADIVGESRRFTDNVGNIAVEIARLVLHVQGTTDAPDANLLDRAEHKLRADLPISSQAFKWHTQALVEEHFPRLHEAIKTHLKLTSTALHQIMIPQTNLPAPFGLVGSVKIGGEQQAMDDVLKRMTHVAVLHWHVWSLIVYTRPEEGDNEVMSSEEELKNELIVRVESCDTDSEPSSSIVNTPASTPGPGTPMETVSDSTSYSNHSPERYMSPE